MWELSTTVVRGPFLSRKLCSLLDSSCSGRCPSISVISPIMCFLHPFFFPLHMPLFVFPSCIFPPTRWPHLIKPSRPSSSLSRCLSSCLWSPLFFLPFFPIFSNQWLTHRLLWIDPNYSVHFVCVTLDPHHSSVWHMIIRGSRGT